MTQDLPTHPIPVEFDPASTPISVSISSERELGKLRSYAARPVRHAVSTSDDSMMRLAVLNTLRSAPYSRLIHR